MSEQERAAGFPWFLLLFLGERVTWVTWKIVLFIYAILDILESNRKTKKCTIFPSSQTSSAPIAKLQDSWTAWHESENIAVKLDN